jgi:hypothetical protein
VKRFVSLIHGVRRIHRATPNRAWMALLSEYLLEHGIAHVSSFSWSGGLLRGFSAADAVPYADQLKREHQSAQAAGASLSIVAKSLGGVIAERALLRLQETVEVDLLLRIAVPDVRPELQVPNVSRIVDVISTGDRLYGAGKVLTPLLFRDRSSASGTKPKKILLSGLSHFALTECMPLHESHSTTYELYLRLIEGTGRTES